MPSSCHRRRCAIHVVVVVVIFVVFVVIFIVVIVVIVLHISRHRLHRIHRHRRQNNSMLSRCSAALDSVAPATASRSHSATDASTRLRLGRWLSPRSGSQRSGSARGFRGTPGVLERACWVGCRFFGTATCDEDNDTTTMPIATVVWANAIALGRACGAGCRSFVCYSSQSSYNDEPVGQAFGLLLASQLKICLLPLCSCSLLQRHREQSFMAEVGEQLGFTSVCL